MTRPPTVALVGTDTGVGKTHFGVRLVSALRAQGLIVGVFKPLESGVEEAPGGEPADAVALAEAAGIDDLSRVCPWPLPRPVTPAEELVRLGLSVSRDELREAAARAAEGCDLLVVETAGGTRSPVTPTLTSIDIARILGARTVLVSANTLGTISATVTACESAIAAGAPIDLIVLNSRPSDRGPDADTNGAWIRRGVEHTPVLPFRDESDLQPIIALLSSLVRAPLPYID